MCQPGSGKARVVPCPPLSVDTPLVPRRAWAGASRLELARIKLPGTKGRRGLPLPTQLGNSCGPQEGFTPQAPNQARS